MSLIESAKTIGHDLHAYLRDVRVAAAQLAAGER
jgi:hypothetical protein